MRAILNPEYAKAIYALAVIKDEKLIEPPHGPRFNILPSDEIQKDYDKFCQWVLEHSIPPYIEVP